VQLAPAYVLHHRPYRDTSRILEALTRDYGRLSLFARGVRGPHAKLSSILQPFRPLLVSWSGRGESPQLTGAELAGRSLPLPSAALMSGFYLNELLLKLTTRHDPHPELFDAYHQALESLKAGESIERTLRLFEKRLLDSLGYGLALGAVAQSGAPVDEHAYYHFRAGVGLVPAVADAPGAVSGRSIASLEHEDLGSPAELDDARRVLRAALEQCLEGRELATRSVARAIARRE
jgi:DNA repair protein RecO (recombination protein O)